MNIRFAAVAMMMIALPAFGRQGGHKKNVASTSSAMSLVDATQQRTLPGVRGSQPVTSWKFIVIWKSNTPPETFFWKPDGERWMTCAVSRMKQNAVDPNLGGVTSVAYHDVDLKDIKNGDKLEIIPRPNGRDIMPASIKMQKATGLYFYQGKGKIVWQKQRITPRRQVDLVMP